MSLVTPFSREHFDRMCYLIRGQIRLISKLFTGVLLILGILFLMIFFGVSDAK